MSKAPVERRLAAILAADVVGYSRLMGADEIGTLHVLRACRRELTDPAIAARRGRIVKTTGDGILVEFPSAVDAVACAIAVQQGAARRTQDVPEDKRLVFRIGINIGDVIIEKADIFGDGVNVAARLESLCEPGGLCISRAVRDQVRDKLPVAFDDLGEQSVKNIARPVRLFGLNPQAIAAVPDIAGAAASSPRNHGRLWIGAAALAMLLAAAGTAWWVSREPAATPQHAAPSAPPPAQIAAARASIAVLPFTALGAPERVRVSVSLTDTSRSAVLWSEKYDAEPKDIFSVQDQITRRISGALAVRVTSLELARSAAKPPNNLEAYDLVLRGRDLLTRLTRAANAEARSLFERAIELDPNYAPAYVGLGHVNLNAVSYGWTPDPGDALGQAETLARKAIGLDDLSPGAHALLGSASVRFGDYDRALDELKRG